MDIAVVGIGGVGGYYGGKLARHYAGSSDIKIIFIARGQHLEKIRERGLRVRSAAETFTARPHLATDQPGELRPFDLVLFCVKAYDLEESSVLLRENVTGRTVIITLLNGVDNAERLGNIFPQASVLNGCVYISAFIEAPGLVRQASGSCKLFFGTEKEGHAGYKTIEKIFTDAGIDAEYSADISTVVWEKYLFVSPLASATTYLKKTSGQLLEDDLSKSYLTGLMREVEHVARAQGVRFPDDVCDVALEKVASFAYETKTSLQMDFEKAKEKNELGSFTGYIVRYARENGIPVPYHQEAYDSLSAEQQRR
jgi:2-dehydropantoate 2-reductase